MSPRVWLLVAVVAAVAGFTLSLKLTPKAASLSSGTLLPSPRALPAFTLTAENGQAFTAADLQSRWTIFFVGFTHCPDICPTTMSLLGSVARTLNDPRLQVVMLSIDPERDRPEVLQSYVTHFHPSFRGATAENPVLDTLATQMGFVYMKVPGATPETYTMDHSSALILINPRGQLAGFFTPPFKQEALVTDLSQLLKRDS